MDVIALDNSNNYFEVHASHTQWWTAFKKEGHDWHIVGHNGRVITPTGKRGREIISAVENARKMAAVRRCLG